MIELFLWKWGLYLLIIYGFIANACASPQNLGYWVDNKPLRGTNEFKKDYVRPYWKCAGTFNNFLECDNE